MISFKFFKGLIHLNQNIFSLSKNKKLKKGKDFRKKGPRKEGMKELNKNTIKNSKKVVLENDLCLSTKKEKKNGTN